jgi:hypothetical protein
MEVLAAGIAFGVLPRTPLQHPLALHLIRLCGRVACCASRENVYMPRAR